MFRQVAVAELNCDPLGKKLIAAESDLDREFANRTITPTPLPLGAIVWLLVALDHPFLGEVSIGPEPFEQVYATIMTPAR